MSASSNPFRPVLVPDPVSRKSYQLQSLIGVKSKIQSDSNVDLRARFEQLQQSASQVELSSGLPKDLLDACIVILAALERISLFVEHPCFGCFKISASVFRDVAWTFLPVHTIADGLLNLVMARVNNHSFDALFNGQPILCLEAEILDELTLSRPSEAAIRRAIEKVIPRFTSGEFPKIKHIFVAEVQKLPGMSRATKNRILKLSELDRQGSEWTRTGPRSTRKQKID